MLRAGDDGGGRHHFAEQARLSALQGWRENVLRSLLTVGAITAPIIVLVAMVFRSGAHSWLRTAELGAAGLGFPALRFLPGLPLRVRATLAMTLCWLTGVVALTMFGFSSGPGIVLAGIGSWRSSCLGRVGGLVFIGLSVAAFFAVGVLAARGELHDPRRRAGPDRDAELDADGAHLRVPGLILTTAIDFVIRHVEESSRAAAEALTDLRAAYDRLALLHERFDAAKEEERRFIAHELHDELGQMLTVVKLRLIGARAEGERRDLALVDGMIGRVREDLRRSAPAAARRGRPVPRPARLRRGQTALSGVRDRARHRGDADGARRLDAAREIACFRVVQESLTNALATPSPRRIRSRHPRSRPRSRCRSPTTDPASTRDRPPRPPDTWALSACRSACGPAAAACGSARARQGNDRRRRDAATFRGELSQRARVSVSVFEFVFEGGSRLAVFRLAWVESVGNHGVESGRPAA